MLPRPSGMVKIRLYKGPTPPPPTPRKRKRGRPRKNPLPEPEPEADKEEPLPKKRITRIKLYRRADRIAMEEDEAEDKENQEGSD